MTRRTIVNHWHYEDGVDKGAQYPGIITIDPPPAGWYCWVYPENNEEFVEWMKIHCSTADCCHRFNSGDPMYTVFIREHSEASLFILRWL